MIDEIVSLETAKLAKKKGFKEDCYHSYADALPEEGDLHLAFDLTGELLFTEEDIKNAEENDYPACLAPTQSLLQRWLREVHGIFITIEQDFEPLPDAKPLNDRGDRLMRHSGKYFLVVRAAGHINPPNSTIKDTYELALEAGLQQALKLL